MRVTLRLIGSLVVVATLVVCAFATLQARQERGRLEEELARRAGVLDERGRFCGGQCGVNPVFTATPAFFWRLIF